MKKILSEWNEFMLNEKSISRTLQHISNHDSAFVTAYRNDPKDFTKCMDVHSKNPDNKERNKELKACFMNRHYGVTSVMGGYIEGFGTKAAKQVKEHSFHVVNLNDDDNFKSEIFKFSQEPLGHFVAGEEAEFVTRIGKRPIHFQEGLETKANKQNNTKYLISKLAKKVRQEMKGDS